MRKWSKLKFKKYSQEIDVEYVGYWAFSAADNRHYEVYYPYNLDPDGFEEYGWDWDWYMHQDNPQSMGEYFQLKLLTLLRFVEVRSAHEELRRRNWL